MRKRNLVEKYCKKIHIPYDEYIENTFGFQAYKLNYMACKLKNEIVKGVKNGNKSWWQK